MIKNMIEQAHKPTFVKFGDKPNKSNKTIDYALWFKRCFTLAMIIGFFYLLSLVLTENVVKVLGVILGLVIVRWLVRLILRISFGLLHIAIWAIIIAAVILAVL